MRGALAYFKAGFYFRLEPRLGKAPRSKHWAELFESRGRLFDEECVYVSQSFSNEPAASLFSKMWQLIGACAAEDRT